jgi:hypothetical protein
MKTFLTASFAVALCSVVGCSTPEQARDNRLSQIENYRAMDLPRPASEAVPERYTDTSFHFSYAKPDINVEDFHSAWKMTKTTSSASHGVFVLRSNPLDRDLVEAGIMTNIAGETNDPAARLEQFKRGLGAKLVSYEQVTIDGHPAAIAQYRMINPIDTFTMYQALIPDTNRSLSIIGFAPEREFSTFKQAIRKTILSTKVGAMPKMPNGEGC